MARYTSDNLFRIILELSKVRITIAVAFTTITGYLLARGGYDFGFLLPTLGIFLLACGASVINHLQERKTDAAMERTRMRPLPARKVTLVFAVTLAILEIFAGSLVLYLGSGLAALVLGLVALVWYNAIYTNLKRITPHAVIPGSVIGSIPPLVGWVAAGGSLLDRQALVLAAFFFIWQVPHFYLLAIKYGNQYEAAGLPSITSRMSLSRIRKLVFFWVVLSALAAVAVAFSRLPGSVISLVAILMAGLTLVLIFIPIFSEKSEHFNAIRYFMKINYFVLFVILMLIGGPLFRLIFHC
jgi:protoheme IX farnesyltransferase